MNAEPSVVVEQAATVLFEQVMRPLIEHRMTPTAFEIAQALADAGLLLHREDLEKLNALTWDTTCLQCARRLDEAYAATSDRDLARAERDRAEGELAALRDRIGALCDDLEDWRVHRDGKNVARALRRVLAGPSAEPTEVSE